jgi:hypothetical protein
MITKTCHGRRLGLKIEDLRLKIEEEVCHCEEGEAERSRKFNGWFGQKNRAWGRNPGPFLIRTL